MAPLTLFNVGGTLNEAPKCKSVAPLALKNAYLWLRWPFSMRGYETIIIYGGNHNEAPRRNVLEPLGSKQLSEVKERKGRVVTFVRVHEIGWYLKRCPKLGPPLSHPFSMVQSDVKRFGICG